MNQNMLLVTNIPGAENCAAAITRQLGLGVELVSSGRAALAALRRREYAVVVLDENQTEADPAGADVLWQQTGLAIPIQVNLAISGSGRLLREIRAALQRREREQALALRAATQVIGGEINTTITGLLLQTQLMLSEPTIPTALLPKLQQVAQLAGTLRQQLCPRNAA
jgi:signal transduction histidine kinase